MSAEVSELYPMTGAVRPIKGLYLEHNVHKLGNPAHPFVYANFVSSLDGRISLIPANSEIPYLPNELTSDNDFRLFLELHAQADCLITHGGYLRALHENRLGNILQTGVHENTADLAAWRAVNGLKPQPDIVVASSSLEFPIPESISHYNQRLIIATGELADTAKVEQLKRLGHTVIFAGKDHLVEGNALVRRLAEIGYQSLYLIAGPRMLETMLRARRLARLYLTISHRLLGGERFHSMIAGALLGTTGCLALRNMYYDRGASDGFGQWFAQFDPAYR